MSRRLLLVFLAGLFLAAGSFAPACPLCDQPPASSPIVNPVPEAVFEAAAPGALLPEEQAWVLAQEDGRYSLVNGRFSDRKAADPAHHLLVNSAVWTLLGRRATERTAVLRGLVKNGRLPEDARGEAVALFWTRGTLISPEDSAFLRSVTKPNAPGEPGVGGFEAGVKGTPAPGGVAAAGAPTAEQNAELLQNLRAQLTFTPNPDPRAGPAMTAALEDLIKTPTGREIALQFVATGSKATVEFGEVDHSGTVVVNGRRVLQASGGHTVTAEHPPRVVLNKDYLDTDPDFRRVNMADTLGHELFGHGFEQQRSEKAGISFNVVNHYRGDEANAGLIGWLVGAELGGPLDNGHMWNYLADPQRYHDGLNTNLPYYSTTLSTAEMRAPVATLESRVAGIETERAHAAKYVAEMTGWRPVIEHFVKVHKMDRALFSSITESIDAAVKWGAAHDATLTEIKTYLTSTIAEWKKPESAPVRAEFLAASTSPYLQESEERLAARRERLRGLTAGRKPEPTVPPVPGKLTWEDLYKMNQDDRRDNPRHWEKKK
jgi:hypothetical protein